MFFSKRILQLCSVIRFRDKAIIGRLLLYYCRPPVDDPWIWLFHFMNYNIYPLFYRKTKASVEIIQYFFIFTSFISLMPPPLSCNLLLSFHFFFFILFSFFNSEFLNSLSLLATCRSHKPNSSTQCRGLCMKRGAWSLILSPLCICHHLVSIRAAPTCWVYTTPQLTSMHRQLSHV